LKRLPKKNNNNNKMSSDIGSASEPEMGGEGRREETG